MSQVPAEVGAAGAQAFEAPVAGPRVSCVTSLSDPPPAEPAAPDPPPAEPAEPDPSKPAADLKEVEALVGALNKSAERLQTLWFTFLTVTLYFALSAGTTTHRMLLLEEGLTLPVFNVKLPLLGFYFIAPAFYVVSHAYFLMMLVLLARTARTLEDALETALPGDDKRHERERFRMRLENALFLQIIVGAERERKGANGRVLRAIALLSLAVVPVLLLIMFQLMFLPYHLEWLTWWHRTLTVIDLGVVWTLWPAYRREWGNRLMPRWEASGRMAVKCVTTALVLLFSLALATYPGERVHGNCVAQAMDELVWSVVPANWWMVDADEDEGGYSGGVRTGYDGRFSAVLFGWSMPVSGLTPDRRGLFPNRLWLPDEDFVDDEKLRRLVADNTSGGETRDAYFVSFVDRDLTGAVLIGADLQRADFRGARVAGANFSSAWLQNSRFEVRDGERANLFQAQLQGASLIGAQLQHAAFGGANLPGAMLNGAQLRDAFFGGANLQGASLTGADLQGAVLDGARLQGASLSGAQLQGASLRGAHVWRARGPPHAMDGVDVSNLEHQPLFVQGRLGELEFEVWKGRIIDWIPPGLKHEEAIQRLVALDPKSAELPGTITEKFWEETAANQPQLAEYRKILANILEGLVCDAEAAPHVARRLAVSIYKRFNRDVRLASVGADHLPRIVERLKKAARAKPDEPTDCPGARGMTEADLKRLGELVASVK